MQANTTCLKVGCCGFPLRKLEYAEHFNVAEVQQTFYQPPQISTLERWREQMPPDFEFTLKAWQLITHTSKSPTYRRVTPRLTLGELSAGGSFQATPMVQQAWQITRACAKVLAAQLVLFQCPASFLPKPQNVRQLRSFFATIDRRDLTLLWEPRGQWPPDLILSLCRELNLVHAVDPFVSSTVTRGLIYFRLHGGKDFKHIFTDDELRHVAALIPPRQPAYVMFNNINMLEDATRFKQLYGLQENMPALQG